MAHRCRSLFGSEGGTPESRERGPRGEHGGGQTPHRPPRPFCLSSFMILSQWSIYWAWSSWLASASRRGPRTGTGHQALRPGFGPRRGCHEVATLAREAARPAGPMREHRTARKVRQRRVSACEQRPQANSAASIAPARCPQRGHRHPASGTNARFHNEHIM